jgi:hypothetical protein
MAIEHRSIATLVSMDDKHKIKVGEPSYPIAAAERGKQVIVGANQVMAVGDHDFTKCTLTPSVNFIVSNLQIKIYFVYKVVQTGALFFYSICMR